MTSAGDSLSKTITTAEPMMRRTSEHAEKVTGVTGIASAGLCIPAPGRMSTNYRITGGYPNTTRRNAPLTTTFTLSVIDRKKNAKAYYYAMDWAGNIRYDSLIYIIVPRPIDTMKPVITKTGKPVRTTFTITEERNVPNPPRAVLQDSDQVETGLATFNFVADDTMRMSSNYVIVYKTDTTLDVTPAYKKFVVDLVVIDTTKNAVAYVQATDRARNTVIDSVRYKAPKITSVDDTPDGPSALHLTAQPQPATSRCTLRWDSPSGNGPAHVRVVDMLGKLMWEQTIVDGITECALDVRAFPAGMYVASLTIGAHTATQTLRVQ
jgi:hypothetical protein